MGEDIWPATYDPSVCDEIIAVSDAESFGMTRRLAREEALLTGGSSGLAVAAALRVAAAAGPDAVIVVLLPDGGRGYLSKIFNDEWMADYGFLSAQTSEPLVADVLARKERSLPELVHVHPEESVGAAIALLREYDVSQLPVVKEEPPVMAAEVVGSVVERDLLDALVTGRADAVGSRRRAHVAAAADRRLGRAGLPRGARAGEGGRGRGARGRQAVRPAHPPGRADLPRPPTPDR